MEMTPEQIQAECDIALKEIGPQQPWKTLLKSSDPDANRGFLADSWEVIGELAT